MIPSYLFNDFELKPIVLIDVPFCDEKEKVSEQLQKTLQAFIEEKYDFRIVWKQRKSDSFSL